MKLREISDFKAIISQGETKLILNTKMLLDILISCSLQPPTPMEKIIPYVFSKVCINIFV